MYSEIVLDHFYSARNAYRMESPDVVGKAGEPGGGPFMLLYVKLAGDRIERASFQTFGCAPAIAAGSLLTEKLAGITRAEAEAWDGPAIERALGGLPSHKVHCATIAATALRSVLDAWDASAKMR